MLGETTTTRTRSSAGCADIGTRRVSNVAEAGRFNSRQNALGTLAIDGADSSYIRSSQYRFYR
jgi:hypothetical protein